MLGSRSNRVSSRPAPTPTGDDPPRPTTTAEPSTNAPSAVALTETSVETEPPTPDTDADPDEQITPDEEVESPRTAARIAPESSTAGSAESYLKPVPNPYEVTETVAEQGVDLTPIGELTAREQEVFMLMAHGDTNADIAEELFISEGTVKTHVKRVLSKLYMRDRTQVVVFAYEKGLVVPGAVAGADSMFGTRSYGG